MLPPGHAVTHRLAAAAAAAAAAVALRAAEQVLAALFKEQNEQSKNCSDGHSTDVKGDRSTAAAPACEQGVDLLGGRCGAVASPRWLHRQRGVVCKNGR